MTTGEMDICMSGVGISLIYKCHLGRRASMKEMVQMLG